jgi:hypothetical protein
LSEIQVPGTDFYTGSHVQEKGLTPILHGFADSITDASLDPSAFRQTDAREVLRHQGDRLCLTE